MVAGVGIKPTEEGLWDLLEYQFSPQYRKHAQIWQTIIMELYSFILWPTINPKYILLICPLSQPLILSNCCCACYKIKRTKTNKSENTLQITSLLLYHLAICPNRVAKWESNPQYEVRFIMTVLCFYFSIYKKVQTLKQKQIAAIIQSCCKRLPIQYPIDIPFIKNAQVSLVVCSVILKNFILKILKFAGTVGHDPTTFALTARRSTYWAIFPNKSSYSSLP